MVRKTVGQGVKLGRRMDKKDGKAPVMLQAESTETLVMKVNSRSPGFPGTLFLFCLIRS